MAKILIAGAGLSGLTMARLAADKGHEVKVLETKHYLGGCCADQYVAGSYRHLHGPHILHTNDVEVWDFLKRFTDLTPYRHRVWSETEAGILPIPFYPQDRDFTDQEISSLLFRKYSEKMWATSWDRLPQSVRDRVPPRGSSSEPWYFKDTYQGLPTDGYSVMFENMAAGLDISLGAAEGMWKELEAEKRYDLIFYCGKLDMPYRSIRFVRTTKLQHHVVLNNSMNWFFHTRSTEYSQFPTASPVAHPCVIQEYPETWRPGMEPYYPDLGAADRMRLNLKDALATMTKRGAILLGRPATYQYLNMDQAVRQAMDMGKTLL